MANFSDYSLGGEIGGSAIGEFAIAGDRLDGPKVYGYVASGGISTGGAAVVNRSWGRVGAGGLVTGGSAVVNRSWGRVGDGGLVTGGYADTAHLVAPTVYGYTGQGGIIVAGAAEVWFTGQPPQGESVGGGVRHDWRDFEYLGDGGLRLGGSAAAGYRPAPLEVFAFAGSGRMSISGAAAVTVGSIYDQARAQEEEELLLLGVLPGRI